MSRAKWSRIAGGPMKEGAVSETAREWTLEWNLAFAPDEVVPRLEALFRQHEYAYTREDPPSGPDTGSTLWQYRTTLGAGSVDVRVQPLGSEPGPFGGAHARPRTLLHVTCTGVDAADQARLKRQLTLAFLRVGG